MPNLKIRRKKKWITNESTNARGEKPLHRKNDDVKKSRGELRSSAPDKGCGNRMGGKVTKLESGVGVDQYSGSEARGEDGDGAKTRGDVEPSPMGTSGKDFEGPR